MFNAYKLPALMLAAVTLGPLNAQADTLTYTGITISNGAIEGINLSGQTATVTIEFADGLTALDGVYVLGPIAYAAYEFSEAGLFVVDTPQDNLEFGSLKNSSSTFDLSFYDQEFNSGGFLGMLSGTTAGDQGLAPLDGETLPQFFTRIGDGQSISFIQSDGFQMLNSGFSTLNNGAVSVTGRISGQTGSDVTLTLNTIPEPAALTLLLIGSTTMLRRTR